MSDVTDLKAEVLLLRRENAELIDEIEHLLIKRQHTEDVSTELRELCVDMRKAFIHGNCYRWCEFKKPCDGKCQYIDRMRKLGVMD